MRSTICLALAATISSASAYWRMGCPGTLLEGRLDPIVTPGKVSGHTHVVLGGNGFGPEMTYDNTQKSTCTSCSIGGDMSNYWIPKLYFHAQNGSFISVPVSGGTVYYQQRSTFPGKTIQAFPPGFRMVAGNPELRDYNDTESQQAITHACLNYNGGGGPETPHLPDHKCPDGIRSQVYFPSCWDGVNLDSPNHKSHMAYPSNYNGGDCPASHPQPVMGMFFEFIFGSGDFDNEWYGSGQPFVYAMGDDTGYGLHGDFLNGWDPVILQKGIDTFTTQNAGEAGNVYFNNIFSPPAHYGADCTLPPLIDEPINGVLSALPGCNPVSSNPVPPTNCMATKTIGVVTSSIYTDVTASGWEYLGCGIDQNGQNALPNKLADSTTMTVQTCVQLCGDAGYTISGLEYASQCFCGNSLPAFASPTPGVVGTCNKPCTGNPSQKCGDGNRLSLYQKCAPGNCVNADFTPIAMTGGAGIAASGPVPVVPASPAIYSAALTSPTPEPALALAVIPVAVSPVAPVLAPVATGGQPSSGTNSGQGSSPPPPANTTAPAVVSNTDSASTITLPSGWTAAGCYVDPLEPRALSGINLAWWGQPMTSSGCAAYCAAEGFSIAGTENGGQCFCDNKLSGSSKSAPASECNLPCHGNSEETCGGGARLNVFSKDPVTSRRRRHLSAHVHEARKI